MTIDAVLVILKVSGGLGLFLLGMKHLSEGLQAIAGNKLRKLVATATTNRFAGVCTGSFVTAIVQSSSIVTAMVVGFVSTNLMTLSQAINVIIGANIGTTATAWLIAIIPSAEKLGLGMIAVSAMAHLFAKRERIRTLGLTFLGLGFIFFGLYMMKSGMKPISKDEAVIGWFAIFQATSAWGLIKCITLCAVFTAVIQSSSATTAITMTLAGTGVIGFDTAAASVLGMNIGTTLTAWLASLGGTTEAKRAALAHTLFNIIGVALITPFFLPLIIPMMNGLFPSITKAVIDPANGSTSYPYVAAPMAYLHTGFNLLNTLLFIPFVNQFANLIRKLVPDAPVKEIPRLTILDDRVIATPVLALEQAAKEVTFMGESNIDLLDTYRKLLEGAIDEEMEQHIFHREDILDNIQREITDFLGHVMTGHLQQDIASRARVLLRVTDEFESISDEVASLLKMLLRMRRNKLDISDKGRAELLAVHDQITLFCKCIDDAINCDISEAPSHLIHIGSQSANIKALIQETRNTQMTRLETKSANAMKIVSCMDMLSAYTRIRENLLNIGETISGEKKS
ncbi:MAG: Na/Pi cotransporter family protein [Kiritimatiellae bacterium]|jgi:phosphate:Na+ symporter|nr:Na/Pi cotransporter family protein [Kiritimatiellia bacterium]